MIYCDTSFLMALYLDVDVFHGQALSIAAKFKEPIPYTLLSELELTNGLHRNLATQFITEAEHASLFRQISGDEASGILVRHPLHQADHFAKARELSKKFTPETGARSLDILQVAAALLLKVGEFATFDERQRNLAIKAGLKTISSVTIKKKL